MTTTALGTRVRCRARTKGHTADGRRRLSWVAAMSDEIGGGGGASRSTDPAAGSSAATDVSLREYLGERISALDRHLVNEIAALRRETAAANGNAERAIVVAAQEANERLQAHNGLIEQMRQQAEHFASREALENFKSERHQVLDAFKDETDKRFSRVERFQAMLTGGMIFVSFIGIANLVKVWSG